MTDQIAQALSQLDDTNDSHWTSTGKPDVSTVSEIVGSTVTRAQITAAAPDYTRDNRELPEATATTETVEDKQKSFAAEVRRYQDTCLAERVAKAEAKAQ